MSMREEADRKIYRELMAGNITHARILALRYGRVRLATVLQELESKPEQKDEKLLQIIRMLKP